jgi:hypothetical protein
MRPLLLRFEGRSGDDPLGGRSPRANEPTRNRRDLIGRGILAGAALAGGTTLLGTRPSTVRAAPSKGQDQKIFNFALLLEYLQAAFYDDALAQGWLRGEIRHFAEVVAEHERAHVDYFRKALGAHARTRPTFTFGDATRNERKFLHAAVVLENTGVAAYNGQAANLTKPALAAAAKIVSVEGRHAAWISDLAAKPPAPRAADPGASATEVVRILKRNGLLTS